MNIFYLCDNSKQLNYSGNFEIIKLNSFKNIKDNKFYIALIYFFNKKNTIKTVKYLEDIKIPYIIITDNDKKKNYGSLQICSVDILDINTIDNIILKYLKDMNDLSILDLIDLIKILNMNNKTVAIKVICKNNTGLIIFKNGDIINAKLLDKDNQKVDGVVAIYQMLLWKNVVFKLTKLPNKILNSLKKSIDIDFKNILLDAKKYKQDLEHNKETILSTLENDFKELKIDALNIIKGFDSFIDISVFKDENLIFSEKEVSNKEFKNMKNFIQFTELLIKKIKFENLERVAIHSSILIVIEYEEKNNLLLIFKFKKDANISMAKILSTKVKQLVVSHFI